MIVSRFLKLLAIAKNNVSKEILDNAKGGKFAAGLASEGFAGGYLEALRDVEAILTHGYPSNSRNYWKDFK